MQEKKYCPDCNKEIWYTSTRCKSCAFKLRKHPELTIRLLQAWQDPEYRAFASQLGKRNKGKKRTPEQNKANSERNSHPRGPRSPEAIKALSESRKKFLESEEGKIWGIETGKKIAAAKKGSKLTEQHKANILKSRKFVRPTKIEIILYDNLACMYGPDFVIQEYPINPYSVDCAIPSLMLAFEADGIYWHSLPGAEEQDKIRQENIESKGWRVIRFAEKELHRWS